MASSFWNDKYNIYRKSGTEKNGEKSGRVNKIQEAS